MEAATATTGRSSEPRMPKLTATRACPVVAGVELRALPWVDCTSHIRQEWVGRGWARAVYRLVRSARGQGTELSRELAPLHQELAMALRLDEATAPYKILFCDMHRAQRIWQRHLVRSGVASCPEDAMVAAGTMQIDLALRDELEIVVYAKPIGHGDSAPLPTMLASSSRRMCIGGPDAEGVHYVGADHVIAWMGLGAGGAGARHAVARMQLRMHPRPLLRAAGNSMALPVAIEAVASAVGLLHDEPSGAFTYVALYAGAFDAFLLGLRWLQERRWPQVQVEPLLAAESIKPRRRALQRSGHYEKVVRSAAHAATCELRAVTMLTASPDCPPVSKGRLINGMAEAERMIKAAVAIAKFARILATAIRNMRPQLVLVEQVAGLATHYPRLLRYLLRNLRAACPGYRWYGHLGDAALLRAPHHRERLILVAVRTRQGVTAEVSGAP